MPTTTLIVHNRRDIERLAMLATLPLRIAGWLIGVLVGAVVVGIMLGWQDVR